MTRWRFERKVLALMNKERKNRGIPKLKANRSLRRIARRYSTKMINDKFFGHVAPDGETFLDRVSLRKWRNIGENLACGYGTRAEPEALVKSWMESPPHRKNMLYRTFQVVGVGISWGYPLQGSNEGVTLTAEFGRK